MVRCHRLDGVGLGSEVTQQPRTPTTEAGRYYVERLRKDEHNFHRGGEILVTDLTAEALDAVLAIEADLLAQIEKAVRQIARDETSGRCGAALMRVLTAIRSAAPVELVTHDEIATLAVAAAAASSLAAPQPEPSAGLRAALDGVMRNVVVGSWYDEPGQSGPAVARLHDAEAAMWRLYDLLGLDPGDAYSRAALAAAPSPALNVERLARAISTYHSTAVKDRHTNSWSRPDPYDAAAIAAQYDRLTTEDAP